MSRTVIAVLGIARPGRSALGVGVGAGMLAAPRPARSPSSARRRRGPRRRSRRPRRPPRPPPRRRRVASPRRRRRPPPRRRPSPRQPRSPPRSSCPRRSPACPSRRRSPPSRVIAIMIDDLWAARPQSGPLAGGRRLAGARRGRHPALQALFQSPYPKQVGPVRSSRLYFIAWAAEWKVGVRARGRLAAGARAAELVQGPGARSSTTRTSSAGAKYLYRVDVPVRAAQRLHRRQEPPQDSPRWSGPRPSRARSRTGRSRRTRPLEQRPNGGKIVVPYLANKITYTYDRKTNTYLRSVSGEGKQFDAGVKPKVRIAPKNVIVMHRALRAARRQEAPARRPGHRQRHRLDRDQRQDRSRAPGRRRASPAPTRFYDAGRRPRSRSRWARRSSRWSRAGRRSRSRTARCRHRRRRRPRRRHRLRRHGLAPGPRAAGAGRATSAQTARVSRATSAHVRCVAARSRAAATRPGYGSASAQAAAIAVASRAGSPGSTRIPAEPTISGRAPTALAIDRHPGRERLHGGQAGRVGADRLEHDAGARDEPGEAVVGQALGVGEELGDARPGGGPRERGAIVGRGPDEGDARRPGARAGPRPGGGAAASRARASRSVGRSWRASKRPA